MQRAPNRLVYMTGIKPVGHLIIVDQNDPRTNRVRELDHTHVADYRVCRAIVRAIRQELAPCNAPTS